MKKIFVFLLTAVFCFSMTACSSRQNSENSNTKETVLPETVTSSADTESSSEPVSIRIGALKGPTAMGMVKLMSDSDAGKTETNEYTFSIAASVDEITPAFIKGDFDIAAVPANLASVLYNKMDKNVSVLAINTLGILYICENGGQTVQTIADLKGKTIYASGKGATPEYALNYLLKENGLDPEKDVTIEWKSEHSECVSALVKSEGDAVALLPEPFVTTAEMSNPDIHTAIDLTQEWDKLQVNKDEQSTLLTGVVIARKDFVENHPDAVKLLMDQYRSSVEYVSENTDLAAQLIGQYNIIKTEIAEQALPNCEISFIDGSEMKEKLSGYLSVLYAQNPQAVGGTLPDDEFYYER